MHNSRAGLRFLPGANCPSISFSPNRSSIHRAIFSLLWRRKSIRFCGFSETGSPLAISAHRCPYSSLPKYTPCRNSFNGLSLLLKYASCSRQNFFLCLRPSKALFPLSSYVGSASLPAYALALLHRNSSAIFAPPTRTGLPWI